uniref:Putative secreted protein n=1 Tax=Anopheles triannulatus TaxID=58253 RepID=A0A2M4B4K4_9DIPT
MLDRFQLRTILLHLVHFQQQMLVLLQQIAIVVFVRANHDLQLLYCSEHFVHFRILYRGTFFRVCNALPFAL